MHVTEHTTRVELLKLRETIYQLPWSTTVYSFLEAIERRLASLNAESLIGE